MGFLKRYRYLRILLTASIIEFENETSMRAISFLTGTEVRYASTCRLLFSDPLSTISDTQSCGA